MSDKGFMAHVGGLRGLAIIFVVLFHLNGQFWPQGYLGVDVFLVITGYLLFRSRAAHPGTESLKDMLRFVSKRFCRIVPPMVIIILLSLIVGVIFLWHADETFLSKAGARACTAQVNTYYAREFKNYFASDSAFVPLLHLWYLSVTLHIYFIYAIGNQLLQRLPKRWIIGLLSVAGVASLLLCFSSPLHDWLRSMGCPVWTQRNAVSYYDTLPRLWEPLAGGLILLLPSLGKRRVWATLLSAIGVLVIVAFALIPALSFPGDVSRLGSLVVVVATMLVIRYTPEGSWPLLLGNAPLLWLGRISFSLYLVHMPIIVFGHMWVLGQSNVWIDLLIIAASVLAGWGFRAAVEKRRCPLWLALVLWGVTMIVCRLGRQTQGFKDYFVSITESSYDQWRLCTDKKMMEPWHPSLSLSSISWYVMQQPFNGNYFPLLVIGDEKCPPSFALIGDSHASHLYAGMDSVFRRHGLSGYFLASIIVPFHNWVMDNGDGYTYSPEKEKALLTWLSAHPQITHVVIGQFWDWRKENPKKRTEKEMTDDLRAFLKVLKRIGKQVVLVAPTPEFKKIEDYSSYYKIRELRGIRHPLEELACSADMHRKKNDYVYRMLRKMEKEGLCTVVDPLCALKPGEDFVGVQGSELLMLDYHHLSCTHSKWLIERLLPQLKKALGAAE